MPELSTSRRVLADASGREILSKQPTPGKCSYCQSELQADRCPSPTAIGALLVLLYHGTGSGRSTNNSGITGFEPSTPRITVTRANHETAGAGTLVCWPDATV